MLLGLGSQHPQEVPQAGVRVAGKKPSEKGPGGFFLTVAEYDPMCVQVAKKAKGILTCISNSVEKEAGHPVIKADEGVPPSL